MAALALSVALDAGCRRSSEDAERRPAPVSSSPPAAPAHVDAPAEVPPPGDAADLHLVENEATDSATARFEGTFAGVFSATPIGTRAGDADGESDAPTSRFHRLVVRLDDGRELSTRFARGESFEFVEPFGIDVVIGRPSAFVVLFTERSGEDCVRNRITALVVEPREGTIALLSRGLVGDRYVAFDQCGDWPDFTFRSEGESIRVERRMLRIVTTDPPSAESDEAREEMESELEEARARHRTALVEARARHVGRAALRAMHDAQTDELASITAGYAFEAGRPYVLCGFPRMRETCEALPPLEQSFALGTRPPAL